VKSITGSSCGQLFVTNFGYCKLTLIKSKSQANLALKELLIKDVGIPEQLIQMEQKK
jgi:hypothetical protein